MLSPAPTRDEPNPPRDKLPVDGQRLLSGDFALVYQATGAFPGDVKSSQVANPHNAFCIVQRASSKAKRNAFCMIVVFFFFAAPPACAGWADCALTCLRIS